MNLRRGLGTSLGWGRPAGTLADDAAAHAALGWGGPTPGGGTLPTKLPATLPATLPENAAGPAHITRPTAQACLAELEETLVALQAQEAAGRAAPANQTGAVLLLRDRLELYMETAPPGEAYQPTSADIAAAAMAAQLLEGAR